MRPGVLIRAAALVLLVWVVACCSSLSSVVAFNDSDKAIDLEVRAPRGQGYSGRLEPGASVEAWSGFRGPRSMTFVVNGKKTEYTFDRLPAGFGSAGSGGAEAHWRWKGRGADFKVVVGNRVSRWVNQMMALGCALFLVFAIAVRAVIVSLQKKLAENRRL